MTDNAPSSTLVVKPRTEADEQSLSGTQLSLTTDDLAQLLDVKEAQRDRAHTLLAQAQEQLSAAQREVDEAEEGLAVVESLAKRGHAVVATLA